MIPSAFDYAAPDTVEAAIAAIASTEDSKFLAGGQSLLPVLRLRLNHPDLIVDLRKIDELKGVRMDGDQVVIGAMTTHAEVAENALVREHLELLSEAAATVADPAIRHRGTLGGSLAHADPAGDLPAAALALDASFVIAGASGRRTVAASDFFKDFLTTDLAADEILVEIRFPSFAGWGVKYEKFNRTAQAWAIVGVAAAVRRENGTIAEARVALTNMGATPIRCAATESALNGAPATAETVAAAAASADAESNPTSDLNAKADYRRHLARVLTGRAVTAAAGI